MESINREQFSNLCTSLACCRGRNPHSRVSRSWRLCTRRITQDSCSLDAIETTPSTLATHSEGDLRPLRRIYRYTFEQYEEDLCE